MKISAIDKTGFISDGFLLLDRLIQPEQIPVLHRAFTDLFSGQFETGVQPDEVNWQQASGDPSLTRQICNGWKANKEIARVVFNETIARAIAELSGWSGIRLMHDNVIWKPVGARSLGYHQDSSYLSWFKPSDLLTCWIALDDTSAEGGSLELIRGSHRWSLDRPAGEFHAPENYRLTMEQAAEREGVIPEICYVEVKAGGGSFHHGWTWHGSGVNSGNLPRRSLIIHAMRSEVEYQAQFFDQGIGPIYSRYRRLGDNFLDENYFPILWRNDGYRTPQIDDYLKG